MARETSTPRWRPVAWAVLTTTALAAGTLSARRGAAPDRIDSPTGDAKAATLRGPQLAAFDLVQTTVRRVGTRLVFTEQLAAAAGTTRPTASGTLAGSSVYSYVWPTSLEPSAVGFAEKTGTLALAATSHPDFDDTPKYDENGDGDPANDGTLWHSHWVVLTKDDVCGPGALKVRDIPAGTTPKLPATWPGLPLFIDSPGYEPQLSGRTIRVDVPLKDVGFPTSFAFDGVTAALRVNASVHDPLLCVVDVFDIASRTLTLPGKVTVSSAPKANP
ncbi:MAG: hypothetical protein ACK6DP_19810 [Gemmatimonas sp.]|jgi:hypothetical protein|uniref:hypothetical protein n=1 Tax=Gemmatimonas sp. TaxID=1962908 RepID=UPI00391F4090